MEGGDLARFDVTLAPFSEAQIGRLRERIAPFVEPFPIGHVAFASADGRRAEGELVVIPHTASELIEMAGRDAVRLVQSAVDIAFDRGAGVVGLGGFSSIISDGGLALTPPPGLALTSGNSLTAFAALEGTAAACRARGVDFSSACVAVVGAAGSIGKALSLISAETCGELILIGNPAAPEASRQRLRWVAEACAEHVGRRVAGGGLVILGSVADRLLRGEPIEHCIRISTDLDSDLFASDIILTATSATRPFIEARHLRPGAIVTDVSRPFNVVADLSLLRPDVLGLRGGLVRAPTGTELGLLADDEQSDCLVACAAETMLLSASGHRSSRLCGEVDAAEVHALGALAEELGLKVV
jgi:predicted amino acid dehydrogenase